MVKAPSPLVGFNNNVKHQGRVFHVQTEDSGIKRPHIVTHLFVDGGRIIKSTRTDYSEHIGRPDMTTVVRRMMKEQHKAMFIALRDGQLNDSILEVLGTPAEDGAKEARPSKPPPLPSKRRSKPAPTLPEISTEIAAGVPTIPPEPVQVEKPSRVAEPLPRKPAPTLTDLMLADLESARSRRGVTIESPKPVPKGGTPVLGTPTVPSRVPGAGRYAPSRPAAIFTATPDQGSIFGSSSISEQSLDEVILSYLAEDLDGTADD